MSRDVAGRCSHKGYSSVSLFQQLPDFPPFLLGDLKDCPTNGLPALSWISSDFILANCCAM
jgi:hypothetical protein